MLPELEKLSKRIEDVRWIFLTHGHIDHMGGAVVLWELTGRRAQIVMHEADAPLPRSKLAHLEQYVQVRAQYLNGPDGIESQLKTANHVISGEMERSLLVTGGEKISLGGDVTISVHQIPGHTAGSVAYVVDGRNSVFVGDAVQLQGAANGFPGYEDPAAYRSSLRYLRDEVTPEHLYLGHPYKGSDGVPYGVELDRIDARRALDDAIAIEARIAVAADRALEAGLTETDSVYSPFESIATEIGYTGDPRLEPSPFFTTLDGYRRQAATARRAE